MTCRGFPRGFPWAFRSQALEQWLMGFTANRRPCHMLRSARGRSTHPTLLPCYLTCFGVLGIKVQLREQMKEVQAHGRCAQIAQ